MKIGGLTLLDVHNKNEYHKYTGATFYKNMLQQDNQFTSGLIQL